MLVNFMLGQLKFAINSKKKLLVFVGCWGLADKDNFHTCGHFVSFLISFGLRRERDSMVDVYYVICISADSVYTKWWVGRGEYIIMCATFLVKKILATSQRK